MKHFSSTRWGFTELQYEQQFPLLDTIGNCVICLTALIHLYCHCMFLKWSCNEEAKGGQIESSHSLQVTTQTLIIMLTIDTSMVDI